MTAITNCEFTVAGVTVKQDEYGRFCLNDLHKAAGNENRHRPSLWSENQQAQALVNELESEAGIPALVTNHGGTSQGTYVCKELVYAYAMWISPAFHLKVIRAYDGMAQIERQAQQAPQIPAFKEAQELALLNLAADFLRVAPSGRLQMIGSLFQLRAPDLAPLLPGYAVDAPQGAITAGSSAVTFSVTELLKRHGIKMATHKFNEALHDAGLLEQAQRKSANGGYKKFWSVTSYGQQYGKNVTSASNPRETQPHWYEARFPDLLEAVGILSPA